MNRYRLSLVAIIILGLIVVDLGAGLFFLKKKPIRYIRTFHPYYHHGFRENRHAVEPWSDTQQYELFTNSLGFRDRSIRTIPLTTPKHRIVLMGDSFTEGVDVPYDETFAGIVGSKLDTNRDVLNAGVISYSPIIYYLKTEYLLNHIGLKFDELIVLSDISDVLNDYGLEMMQKFEPRVELTTCDRMRMTADNFLREHSFVWWSVMTISGYRKYHRMEQEVAWWTLDADVYNRWGKPGLDISCTYMQKLADLCKSKGIRMTIVVYPWAQLIRERDLHSKQVVYWSEFADTNGLGFIDLFPLFINEAPPEEVIDRYFLDDGHWNREGHALVARALLKHLRSGTP